MKTKLLNSIAIIACLCVYACDWEYDPPPIPTTKTSCIHVVDALTNEPLDSVQVKMTLRYKDSDTTGHNVDFYAYSDTSGTGCVSYDKGPSVNYLMTCTKPGYSTYTLGDHVNWFYIDQEIEVKLLPAGNIRFHVKNEAPKNNDDFFFIILPNDYSISPDTLLLSGSDIDTTWVKTISVGNHNLTWVYSDELTGSITVEQKYFVEKNTTTDIEILY